MKCHVWDNNFSPWVKTSVQIKHLRYNQNCQLYKQNFSFCDRKFWLPEPKNFGVQYEPNFIYSCSNKGQTVPLNVIMYHLLPIRWKNPCGCAVCTVIGERSLKGNKGKLIAKKKIDCDYISVCGSLDSFLSKYPIGNIGNLKYPLRGDDG